MAGLDDDGAGGIKLIEAAARYHGENRTDARLILALIYNRERRYDEAVAILRDLQSRYSDNRLLWLEAGSTALRAGHFQEARRFLDDGQFADTVGSRTPDAPAAARQNVNAISRATRHTADALR